ncbi:putative transporter [Desulfovibrio sp. TomC]|uniref:putative transporter n=1 Tax=Desulfovibrio sp. TomC TaxID=1562888 RepID=UPI0005755045|nr:putative transporter [Desulfovibrio sp. TomC]KHK04437.1 putative transport protein [Desulfovibrio sp. TomC]
MGWLTALLTSSSAVSAVAVLGLVAATGLALGRIPVAGVRLGVGGVLFSGLAAGHFGLGLDHHVLEFVREFGLILFVYAIGMQVGPGFVDSLRRRGLRLNVMAAFIVVLGAGLAAAFHLTGLLPLPVAVGLYSGAVTNTPALAAASQAFAEVAPALAEHHVGQAGLGYAVAYPFGIFGIILTMLVLRRLFRIDPAKETQQLEALLRSHAPPLTAATIEVAAPAAFGLALSGLAATTTDGVVVSRIMDHGTVRAAGTDTILTPGMLLHAVGRADAVEALCRQVGRRSQADLPALPGPLEVRQLIVTRSAAVGRTVPELGLDQGHDVAVTRIIRSGTEFSPGPDVPLHWGDRLRCVGTAEALTGAEAQVGNSSRDLAKPHILPIFIGILLGTALGSIPVPVPGLPTSVRLGVAGGPLLVSILLSRLHHFGGLVWYLPQSANLLLREIGITLFLSCVGLAAGSRFVASIASGQGLVWFAAGAVITFVPLLTAGVIGRVFLRCNYASTCGLLAGSMTDPPALAFASQMLGGDAPASVYATVYPLAMILRIVTGQLLVLTLFSG